ncbi:MAG: fibronectin type III domain-containing protein [Chlorobi bacterium OLB5]|nr:MAG: fibronectin type III domain-containing protein [Chlorobi bacterium OLB5]
MYGGFATADDDINKYTNVGNIGLTVTNFGTIGHGFTLWPGQPSLEYPKGSQIEHLFDGGLWIGGKKNGVIRVTTGAIDASSSNRGEGFEYTNAAGQIITQRSSLLTSPYYSQLAVSHQDFICEYTDTATTIGGQLIVNHNPLGLKIIQSSYCWNYPYADFFVIMRYRIINIGYRGDTSPIDSVFTGMWTDLVVRNTQITRPGGSSFYTKGGNGWDSLYNMGYEFDATGDVGYTNSYVGIKFLGSTPYGRTMADTLPTGRNFVSWQFRNTVDPTYFAPLTDADGTNLGRYSKMNGYFTAGVKMNSTINSQIKQPSNRSVLVSNGPYTTLNYLDTLEVVFGVICAKKTGNDPQSWDSSYQRTELRSHADWCQKAYNGEDKNGNGRLDPGEDINGNGILDRYLLPSPPNQPITKIINDNNKVTVYWAANAESSIDPISLKQDFEGYRIYRTNAGADIDPTTPLLSSFILNGDFDSINNIGNNTGFNFIKLPQAITFPNDPNQYWYRFEYNNQLRGWQYVYALTAYDKGDTANDLESLESSLLSNSYRIIPGTGSLEDEATPIGVYPNPYYVNAAWDGLQERERKIYFFNLPELAEITIYTVAGDVVDRFTHDARSYTGSDIQWFKTFADGTQILAGGEHAWDLISRDDQAIATGLYLFTVKNQKTGFIKKGKFLVIK